MKKETQKGLIGLGELMQDALQDFYKEGSVNVARKVARAQYTPYVEVVYRKTKKGFALEGELLFIESLTNPVYKAGMKRGRYYDSLLLMAVKVHAVYDKHRKHGLRRINKHFYFSDHEALEFKKFINHKEFAPSCLVLAAVDRQTQDELLAQNPQTWESYFATAERELVSRIRQWRKSKGKKENGGRK